jgi:hypothetical protein
MDRRRIEGYHQASINGASALGRASEAVGKLEGEVSPASSLSEGWYRYGDSNPGPVAENHVS